MKKLIIDTDGAPDDVRAISLALQTPDVEVIAITCVHGVVNVDQAVANIARTLRANKRSVPIYKGSAEPLIAMTGKTHNDEYFFGPDGLGGKPDNFPKVIAEDFENYDHSKPAALALIDLFKQNPDVTLVAIGPLTNVALALKLDPEFARRPQNMVIMGGNIYAVGNMGSQFTAEFNFGGDPEAAHIVVDKMRCPVTLVPWEAIIFDGLKHQKEIDFEAHLGAGTPLADFFSTITAIGREVMHKNGRQYCYVDEIAMGVALFGDIMITESKMIRGSVELNGEHTRGQMALDWIETFYGLDNIPSRVTDTSHQLLRFVVSYNAKYLDEKIHEAVKNCV